MSVFLTKVQINKVFHLENISVEIDAEVKKHLILTGKNGSGKTSVLSSIAEFLQNVKNNPDLSFLKLYQSRLDWQEELEKGQSARISAMINDAETAVTNIQTNIDYFFGKVRLEFNNIYKIAGKLRTQRFILAYYTATRKTEVIVPKTPEKPDLRPATDIKVSKISEFLKFLVDLKIQEALARNENNNAFADEIKNWFVNFTGLLEQIFEGDKIQLDFNYRNYAFIIKQGNRQFGFNELSDGYSAIIDIVADLIIKMQSQDSLTRAYEKEGIVLIDEVETHLHLKLQRLIMPMLTQIFPNIQFIVTTHSPFVLNSLDNAVAFDLEKCTRLENLNEYSYEALAEGYFKVETESGFLLTKIERFRELSQIAKKDSAELSEYKALDNEFSSMNDVLTSPNIKGQYLQIKLAAI